MAKAMTKSQIMDTLAKENNMTKKQANEIVESLINLAYKESKNGFTLPGLGKLVLVKRKARMGRNPQTGEPLKIPAKRVCKFRIGKACKDAVLGKK
ncbi:MAG: HU family DNA-binding protein [Nitrospinota bacterium]